MSYPNLNYSGGYPSNQQGSSYPGQMQGQQGGYPGQQGAYPGQQGAYPGQQGGYPGQQGAYPGQQGAYPGQQSGYPSQQGGYPGQQSLGGGYGSQGYPGTHPSHPGVSPDVQQWFNTVDSDRSGKISAKELQAALVNGQGKHFSDTACSLMIGMFDQDKTGTIDINEFQLLFNYINQWISTFKSYDRDDSGNIEEHELTQALQQMGFRFSPEFVKYLITKSDSKNRKNISVDHFIVICVQIQKFTEAFRARDKDMQGVITIGFEDFLTLALSCSV